MTMGVVAVLVAGVATGCGGDGDEGSTTTEAVESVRLTDEQWSEYEAVRADFVSANTTATKRFDRCADLAETQAEDTASQEAFQKCVGNVYGELATVTDQVGQTLVGFQPSVQGACAEALAAFLGYIQPYERTAQQIQQSVDDADLIAYNSAGQDLTTAADQARPQVEAFETDCKPVA
jgi:hypothetical protein